MSYFQQAKMSCHLHRCHRHWRMCRNSTHQMHHPQRMMLFALTTRQKRGSTSPTKSAPSSGAVFAGTDAISLSSSLSSLEASEESSEESAAFCAAQMLEYTDRSTWKERTCCRSSLHGCRRLGCRRLPLVTTSVALFARRLVRARCIR